MTHTSPRLSASIVRTRHLRIVAAALEPRGIAPGDVCIAAGLVPGVLEGDLDAPVSIEDATAFFAAAIERAGDPDLVFRAGRDGPDGSFSVAELPLFAASDLEEVEEVLVAGFHEARMYVDTGRTATTFTLWVHAPDATPVLWDLLTGSWLRIVTRLGLGLRRVDTPMTSRRALQWMAPQVGYNTPVLEIGLDADESALKGNAFVFRSLLSLLGEHASVSFDARLRAEVRRALHSGEDVTVSAVAERLGMSTRTLQRRLGELGRSFRPMLTDVRCTYASRLLRDPSVRINEVSVRVGFSESSSFVRAFRAWSGVTPTEWRARYQRLTRLRPAGEEEEGVLRELADLVSDVPLEPLVRWAEGQADRDSAVHLMATGWVAARSENWVVAQSRWTDALRELTGQRRRAAAAHVVRALAQLYVVVGETALAEEYLRACEQLAVGVSEHEPLEAALLRCIVRVRGNRVKRALSEHQALVAPAERNSLARFHARSAMVMVEAGQPQNAMSMLGHLEEADLVRSVHQELVGLARLLLRAGRFRMVRRVLAMLEPLEEDLEPSLREVVEFVRAASTPNERRRLELLDALQVGTLPVLVRVAAARRGLATARELHEPLDVWVERLDIATTFANNMRASLRDGEIRGDTAVRQALHELLKPPELDPRTLELTTPAAEDLWTHAAPAAED